MPTLLLMLSPSVNEEYILLNPLRSSCILFLCNIEADATMKPKVIKTKIIVIIADAFVPNVSILNSYRLIIVAVIIGGNYYIINLNVQPQTSF